MIKNPYANAVLAALYIVAIVLFINYGTQFAREKPDTILIPMAMLSLFVLSAALMGLLFLLQPVLMYLDGKKKDAVSFFLTTLGTFAGITVVVFAAALLIH
ncbi:hypothetical protein A2765_04030 [Candidatus Kaiserbacteria bacterium RIFCSPHIGHO2_01_FULL_56_24]|uniref:Uncharacterized protein n=1 Tax=Candidatus Kaiserbacteria bacterium RIFCSPHIGHO2_01_FULL_56_24 TaxID=1798487 RepID=A0A1F6DE78_9BACT|nr:MAG: hypothetical protein A2765_04030 [Candidatus Kaiserbacteria bacterium RIFCSPHIGHO2_01_FULL_56_24]